MTNSLIDAKTLLSRKIRANLASGKRGANLLEAVATANIKPRVIASMLNLTGEKPKENSFISWVFNAGKTLVGFIGGLFNAISFSASQIWGWVVSGLTKLKAFNWNASDEELKKMIDSANLGLASVWGSFVGAGVGWIAGIGIGYGISFACPVIGGAALARVVAANAGKEALEELGASLKNAIGTTVGTLANNALVTGYMNYRRLLKNAPEGLLNAIYGSDTAKFIRNTWGNKGGPNLSFNTQMEEAIEAIPNEALKRFLDAALEEAWDSFCEAGFVVAQEIDSAYAQHKLGQANFLGSERSVTLLPDKEVKGEKLTLYNLPQKTMMATVQQTINTQRLINNRDVGALVGMPIEDYMKAKPQTLRLVIQLFSIKEPPFVSRSGSAKLQRVTITIPDARRSSVDWDKIKLACGGPNGYTYGHYRATANLDNGRQMALYASSPTEAENRLRAFVDLSTAKILTLSITDEKKTGERLKRPQLYKEAVKVYPVYFTVINREEYLDSARGKASLTQSYGDKKSRISLWPSVAPPDTQEIINRLFTKGL